RSKSTASPSPYPPSSRSSVPRLAAQIGPARRWAHTTARSWAACWACRTLHSTHCSVTALSNAEEGPHVRPSADTVAEERRMAKHNAKTLVIRHGTLIDGSGHPAVANEAIVIEGNRIRSVGRLPEDIRVEDQDAVHVIDATGQWIMPGLID